MPPWAQGREHRLWTGDSEAPPDAHQPSSGAQLKRQQSVRLGIACHRVHDPDPDQAPCGRERSVLHPQVDFISLG
jgi:hypothetical protein